MTGHSKMAWNLGRDYALRDEHFIRFFRLENSIERKWIKTHEGGGGQNKESARIWQGKAKRIWRKVEFD